MTSPPDHDLRSFTELISPRLVPSDLQFVTVVYTFAEARHGAQLRHEVDAQGNRKRFFSHPIAVARLLIERLDRCNAEEIATALCHDLLEDTPITAEELESHVGERVAREVELLSQLGDMSKSEYAARLVQSEDARLLLAKVCDILHNARTFRACPPDKQASFVESVRGPYAALLDRAIELADPRIRSRVAEMVTEIRQLVAPTNAQSPTASHAAA